MGETFVHLHLHTEYSTLDGAVRCKEVVKRAVEYGMPAVAMTDHGNLFGAIEFYEAAKAAGVKPILGCEIYLAPEGMDHKKEVPGRKRATHLTLLAENNIGWANLVKLVTVGHLEGLYYGKPRVDREKLREYAEGMICLSGCISGPVNEWLRQEDPAKAREAMAELRDIYGAENLYVEIHDHGLEMQQQVKPQLIEMAKEMDLKTVVANDVHFMTRDDHEAHDVMICIGTGKLVFDENRMRYSPEVYFKSAEEMRSLFADIPEACDATLEIAERCNVELSLDATSSEKYPNFESPDGSCREEYLRRLCFEGLEERYGKEKAESDPELKERLEYEISTINELGFASYFLITADFIKWARDHDIPVGPGRGSAAGSLVAYTMGITDICPMRFGLLFERFLNPERVSMPDIDIDFCMDGRDEVIKYVTEKYGGNQNVTQIITFGSMNAKGVIRDVGRVLDMTYGEVDKLAKLVPNKLNITLKDAFKEEPQFEKLRKENPKVAELLDIAKNLEGLQRHCSTHAAGVVISSKALTEFCPLYKGSNDEVVTQYAMGSVEKLGLLKMDFLGLRTLTVVDKALKMIQQSKNIELDISAIPMNDPATFKLLCDAKTLGVFQLESSGMRDLLKKLKPDGFEDITALLAMYRPGPLESGMVDDYVKRKHGTMEEKYDLPQLESILKETHGVILYQEQVMKIASVLAGFSMGDADLLRRAMGKKNQEEMAAQREKFMEGSRENKINEKKSEKIFNLMEKFAGYGFNKSHSTAYAQISYQTAFLKAHYPLEFFVALITSDMDNTDKVIRYIHDCREMNITVQPPDVNLSHRDFSVSENKLVFGLGAIKNVGGKAIDNIIEARQGLGRFTSMEQLCENVDMQLVNKRVFEGLIKSGACDSLGQCRAGMMKELQACMERGQGKQRDEELGQFSMFDSFEVNVEENKQSVSNVEEWSDADRLRLEKESIGFYITGHPLDGFTRELSWFTDATSASIAEAGNGKTVSLAGIPIKHLSKTTRRGDKMGIITLEDLQGSVEVILWPEIYSQAQSLLLGEEPLLVKGEVDSEGSLPKVIAKEVFPLAQAKQHFHGRVLIHFRTLGLERETLVAVKGILASHKGNNDTRLHFIFPDDKERVVTVAEELRIQPSDEVIQQIQALLGEDAILFE